MLQRIARLLYSKREAAILLGISERSLDHLINSHQLRPRRIGKRVLLPYKCLVKFANSKEEQR